MSITELLVAVTGIAAIGGLGALSSGPQVNSALDTLGAVQTVQAGRYAAFREVGYVKFNEAMEPTGGTPADANSPVGTPVQTSQGELR